MAKRGDKLAKELLNKNEFQITPFKDKWLYLETKHRCYDRMNPILIEILREGKLSNIGGWTLEIYSVPVENFAYKIIKSNDCFGSEYIIGGEKIEIKYIDDDDDDSNVIKDNIIKDNIIKDNVIKDDIIKDDIIKDDIIKDDIIKDDIIKDDIIKDNVIKDNVIKDDIIKDNVIKNSVIEYSII
jgi:hypothetical protein